MPVPKNFTQPDRVSAKERVLCQIQRWIIEGILEPGELLIEEELAETLSVSKTPVREALQLLETQGLVALYPGKEARVTGIEKEQILKIYPALAALHALAAEQASRLIMPEQIEVLKHLNTQFTYSIESDQPYRAMELDEKFHNLIVEAADNSYITSYSTALQIQVRRYKYLFLKQRITSTSSSAEEHSSIIDALEKRESQKAAELMKQNLIRPMNELYALL